MQRTTCRFGRGFPVRPDLLLVLVLSLSSVSLGGQEASGYDELKEAFASPDHARWGEVALWWWEGDRVTRERVRWQLQTLAARGVKAVCPIQRSPGRCDPPSFSPPWWEMFEFVHAECQRLGMSLWAYDQVGYGQYGWLEKAAAKTRDKHTRRLVFLSQDGDPSEEIRMELPAGELIAARAYPIEGGIADDGKSIDLSDAVRKGVLVWTPAAGNWRVATSVAVPYQSFQLSRAAAEIFIDMLYGQIERRLGKEAMGGTFRGIFQDEHPPTPRDIFTRELEQTFRERSGYDIGRAIPALHFDVGPRTPSYRTDFLDAYLALDERSYWKRVYDWTAARGLLTSHDNWGRNDIYRQSQGYIDYFRTQRWFSSPGYDDYGQASLHQRNYYDTKIAASIARLYERPRVWNEAFHSSGWGRTTEQTLTWLSAGFAFGANLYNEHGLYYSTRASTWEHAAPDPHWRQPYWRYYRHLSDWVARMSYLISQGNHVVDVAVHYPVVSLLAGEPPGTKGPDYNLYMQLSRVLYDAGMDNDIVDDDSILRGSVKHGRLFLAGNAYQALVFGPETTVRRSVLDRARALVESGGTVIFFGRLPSATAEGGRDDPQVAAILQQLLGVPSVDEAGTETISRNFEGGGFSAFVPASSDDLPPLISSHIERDFLPGGGKVFVHHRRVGAVDVYLVLNATKGPMDLNARCRVDGVPELWDARTGEVGPVDRFERAGGRTHVEQRLEGNTASLFVFRPGRERLGENPSVRSQQVIKPLADDWRFSVLPTRDNRWGEFRWPPSDELIGPEVRSFRYAEETSTHGLQPGWQEPQYDDKSWQICRASIGPYWLVLGPLTQDSEVLRSVLEIQEGITAGARFESDRNQLTWRTVEFSKSIGLARAALWGGHSGYPDGAIDQNFVELARGRKLLFTRIRSPRHQRLGLRVELGNSTPRLWVNGTEQPFEGATGNLPLLEGENTVLLDLRDGERGMLFVQPRPPSVASMQDAVKGLPMPDLSAASWIWGGNTSAGYVRKTFDLEQLPVTARVVITAYTGYRLFVNGVKIEEEIGPWATWKRPDSFNIAPHLRTGENVLAVWGQVHADLGTIESKGLILAMKTRDRHGKESSLTTNGSWRGSVSEQEGWEQVGFDDSAWNPVRVLGPMGVEPWGRTPLENMGAVTEPQRRRAIDLPSPYLECFKGAADLVYDVKRLADRRVGWYRFVAPPGLRRLLLRTGARAQVWVDGIPASVSGGTARIENPPRAVSTVAVRLEMEPGAYGGAAFPLPIGVELEGGTIRVGEWTRFGLPTYSGIGVYEQTVLFAAEEVSRQTLLDLGQVLVSAEVLVNGVSAGVRLARPFRFDLTGLVREGGNTLEVRVANTIAPHYTVTNRVANLGPTASGLIGPVRLYQLHGALQPTGRSPSHGESRG